MGKMKNLVIDQMNDEGPVFDSAGYMSADNQLDPPPSEINIESGKMMWELDGYRIWADSYQQALQLLTIIDKF